MTSPALRDLEPSWKIQNRQKSASSIRSGIKAAMTNPDLLVIAIFCAIGLGITINLILRFPDFGALSEQLQLFP